jgi:hypothetical protein
MTMFEATAVVAVFAALVVAVVSLVAVEKKTLKFPELPAEAQPGTVGLIKKATTARGSEIAPTAAVFAAAVDKSGTLMVAVANAVPVAVLVAPSAQVAATRAPFTVNWANALVPTKDKTAIADKALVKFFMVISFKVRRDFSRTHAPIGAKSWLVWMPLSRPHQLVCR